MIITKIENQKKNAKRWSIYIDDEFAFGISEDTLLKFGLRVKDDITEDSIQEIKSFDEYIFAKKTAFDLLAYRIRSIAEIRDKLKTKKISVQTIEKTIEHLQALGLLNDEQFALQLVNEKISGKPVGKQVLRQKLYQKGIRKEIAEKVLDEVFSKVDEKKLALTSFKKYFPKLADLEKNKKKKKAFDFLARKGFDFDIINEVIRENIK